MYRRATIAITNTTDTATIYMSGTDLTIPVIGFGEGSNAFEITLNSHLLTPAEQAAWLRNFAHQVTSLAEIIDAANVNDQVLEESPEQEAATLAPYPSVPASAITCDCGAVELPDRYAGQADDEEAGVIHAATWCGDPSVVSR